MPRRTPPPTQKSPTTRGSSRTRPPTNITPAFASWVRNVIAPALVKAYMRELSLKKGAVRG
jgi:hypothetical protein